MTAFIASVKADIKKIAGDVLTIAITLGAVLAVVNQVSSTVHLPAWANAAISTATSVVAAVVLQARRFTAAKAPVAGK